jgi:hypothetical protein
MELQSELKQQRWGMMTNPFVMKVPLICKATELEIIEHLLLVNNLPMEFSQQFSKKEIDQCRARFWQFCRTQWDNRNIS